MPVQCLADLRFVELVFPPCVSHGWPDSERAIIFDWIDTVDWIRDKIDAPALTLSLVMTDFHGDDAPNIRGDLTKDQEGRLVKGYSSILHLLKTSGKRRRSNEHLYIARTSPAMDLHRSLKYATAAQLAGRNGAGYQKDC